MLALSRTDTSTLGRWWWTVDRWTLVCIAMLIGFGYVLVLASSPAVAHRIGDPRYLLILKQVTFLALAGALVVGVSLMPPKGIRWLALIGTLVALLLTGFTLVHGVEIKGARRWINIPFLSLQPSEFLKPFFAVVTAGLLVEARNTEKFPGRLLALMLYGLIALLLKTQPDIGMLAVISIVFLAQLFLDGLNLALVGISAGGLVVSFVAAFFLMPHVHVRVERFLHPTEQTAYQALTALQAFGNGGLLGRGPGEGMVKDILPDARPATADRRERPVRAAGLGRPAHQLRPSGLREHGLLAGTHPDQGHDAALHLLWRVLGAVGRGGDGHAARPHAAPCQE
jgi:cell division protein FtsW